ncbi:MAG: GTP-binding protein [Desulfovibrio sp.]|nr:GTP-binding protein [Desulfovibrio sp.]
MKVLVVSGFLGAGKTTFITEMAHKCRQKFVVMENEMGAVGVDGGFLASSLGSDVDVWELTEGCICCSMKSDFASGVLTIENALQPDFLLVEPTGVGMLGRIIENLKQIAYERIEILSPITILDSLNWRLHASEFPEIFADQLSAAGTVVFSKAENLPPEERTALEELVNDHAPTAEVVSQPYARQPAAWWDEIWRKALDGTTLKEEPEADATPDLSIASLTRPRVDSPAVMAVFLEDVLHGRFGGIVRAKGTVSSGAFALRFDVAGGQYCLSGAEEQDGGETRAVFIGKNVDTAGLCKALQARPAGQDNGIRPFPS